jgi:hypothetical protein
MPDARLVDLLVWVTASSRDAIVSAYAQAGAEVTGADSGDPQVAAQRFLTFLQLMAAGGWLNCVITSSARQRPKRHRWKIE